MAHQQHASYHSPHSHLEGFQQRVRDCKTYSIRRSYRGYLDTPVKAARFWPALLPRILSDVLTSDPASAIVIVFHNRIPVMKAARVRPVAGYGKSFVVFSVVLANSRHSQAVLTWRSFALCSDSKAGRREGHSDSDSKDPAKIWQHLPQAAHRKEYVPVRVRLSASRPRKRSSDSDSDSEKEEGNVVLLHGAAQQKEGFPGSGVSKSKEQRLVT